MSGLDMCACLHLMCDHQQRLVAELKSERDEVRAQLQCAEERADRYLTAIKEARENIVAQQVFALYHTPARWRRSFNHGRCRCCCCLGR